ncbi:hypothetical protein GCM10027425_11580 [Alteromonas gracilis]
MTVLLRSSLGEVLRAERLRRGLTLRELSHTSRISLGYISEIERGHKEASSELLASLCGAMEMPVSELLSLTSDHIRAREESVVAAGEVVVSAA